MVFPVLIKVRSNGWVTNQLIRTFCRFSDRKFGWRFVRRECHRDDFVGSISMALVWRIPRSDSWFKRWFTALSLSLAGTILIHYKSWTILSSYILLWLKTANQLGLRRLVDRRKERIQKCVLYSGVLFSVTDLWQNESVGNWTFVDVESATHWSESDQTLVSDKPQVSTLMTWWAMC